MVETSTTRAPVTVRQMRKVKRRRKRATPYP
jgi:hypothetical protein